MLSEHVAIFVFILTAFIPHLAKKQPAHRGGCAEWAAQAAAWAFKLQCDPPEPGRVQQVRSCQAAAAVGVEGWQGDR